MRLSLVRTPCSQSHNPHCVPIIQEKWKFSFVGTAMKDVNPFSVLGSLAEDQLPEEASATKPLYTKFLLNIRVSP